MWGSAGWVPKEKKSSRGPENVREKGIIEHGVSEVCCGLKQEISREGNS